MQSPVQSTTQSQSEDLVREIFIITEHKIPQIIKSSAIYQLLLQT